LELNQLMMMILKYVFSFFSFVCCSSSDDRLARIGFFECLFRLFTNKSSLSLRIGNNFDINASIF